jgi:hypothetical protein
MTQTYHRVAATIGAVGLVVAVVCAILYFMGLPIFTVAAVSWMFVYGLIALAVGILAFILPSIWTTTY